MKRFPRGWGEPLGCGSGILCKFNELPVCQCTVSSPWWCISDTRQFLHGINCTITDAASCQKQHDHSL